jgi:hypothetical protein
MEDQNASEKALLAEPLLADDETLFEQEEARPPSEPWWRRPRVKGRRSAADEAFDEAESCKAGGSLRSSVANLSNTSASSSCSAQPPRTTTRNHHATNKRRPLL